jgi:hypothetical protein
MIPRPPRLLPRMLFAGALVTGFLALALGVSGPLGERGTHHAQAGSAAHERTARVSGSGAVQHQPAVRHRDAATRTPVARGSRAADTGPASTRPVAPPSRTLRPAIARPAIARPAIARAPSSARPSSARPSSARVMLRRRLHPGRITLCPVRSPAAATVPWCHRPIPVRTPPDAPLCPMRTTGTALWCHGPIIGPGPGGALPCPVHAAAATGIAAIRCPAPVTEPCGAADGSPARHCHAAPPPGAPHSGANSSGAASSAGTSSGVLSSAGTRSSRASSAGGAWHGEADGHADNGHAPCHLGSRHVERGPSRWGRAAGRYRGGDLPGGRHGGRDRQDSQEAGL